MNHHVSLRVKYIIILISFTFTLIACNKNTGLFGVAIDPPEDYTHIEGIIFKIIKESKYTFKIKHNVPVADKSINYTVPRSSLIVFESLQAAIKFQKEYYPYIGTYSINTENAIVHSLPSIDSKRVGIVTPNIEYKIISGLFPPDTAIESNSANDSTSDSAGESNSSTTNTNTSDAGSWIRIQYKQDKHYYRGWILITENSYINFNKFNNLNPSVLAQNFHEDNYLIEKNDLQYINQLDLVFNPTVLTIENYNSDYYGPVFRIIHKDQSIHLFPISQLWPIGHSQAIIPQKNTSVKWDINERTIHIAFINQDSYLFQEFPDKTIIQKRFRDSLEKRVKVYSMLAGGLRKDATSSNVWNSDLFGTLYTSASNEEFQLDFSWRLGDEIASLHFPQNTKEISGSISLTHILAQNIKSDIDTVLSFYIPTLKKTFFLGFIKVDEKKFILQFISEANVLTDTTHSKVISAPPVEPKMLFEKFIQ